MLVFSRLDYYLITKYPKQVSSIASYYYTIEFNSIGWGIIFLFIRFNVEVYVANDYLNSKNTDVLHLFLNNFISG